jgi:hypothetical protein
MSRKEDHRAMIIDSNQTRLVKMTARRVQEGVLFFQKPADPKSNLILTPTYLRASMILEGEDYDLKVRIEGWANRWAQVLVERFVRL